MSDRPRSEPGQGRQNELADADTAADADVVTGDCAQIGGLDGICAEAAAGAATVCAGNVRTDLAVEARRERR